jgi:PAS domain S-box-containing protein
MIQVTQIVVALLHIGLGILVLGAHRRSAVNRAFAAQSLVFAGWILTIAGLQNAEQLEVRLGFAFAFASLIPVAFLFFAHCYPDTTEWSAPTSTRVAFCIGIAFALLSLATNLIAYEAEIGPTGLTRKTGPLYFLFCLYFLVTWLVGFVIFVKKWCSSKGRVRAQFHYLGAGVIGGFFSGIAVNLLLPSFTGNSAYSWIGPYFSLAYVALAAHATIRHPLINLRLFIHRGLTIGLAIVLSSFPAAVLLAILWPHLLTTLDTSQLVLLLIAISVATILIPIIRDAASRLLDRYVYRTHANYQRTVREASRMLTGVLHLKTLLAFIATTVVRSTAAEGVALYLREDADFGCSTTEVSKHLGRFKAPARAPQNVAEALAVAQAPILIGEIPRDHEGAAKLHDCLSENNWSLLLPVLAEDTLIAMIAVGPKLSGDAFYQQDLDLLMTLANQAGVAIKNAQLYAAVTLANEYLENIAATMESGVVAINAAGRLAMFNRAAEHLTGLPAKTTLGGPAAVLPPCLADPLQATLADGQPRTLPEVELPMVISGDEPESRPVLCTVSPVRDPAGTVLGAVAVFSDLTPLKELEIERRRAERLVYLQTLASGIAHEIKNPLVAIKTFTQLLPRRQGDARFLEEFGRISTRAIDRIQRLLDRLRTLSRPGGGPRHPVDIRLPLTEAVELMQPALEEKGLMITARLGDEPCVVTGNHQELEELFLNLLLNAHDATPTGGAVTVELTRSEAHLTVTVADSGPGIAAELLERVFEPLFTTKARGWGLGLAISAGIAQAHGARLRASNRPTGGAVFTVEFPLAALASAVVA